MSIKYKMGYLVGYLKARKYKISLAYWQGYFSTRRLTK